MCKCDKKEELKEKMIRDLYSLGWSFEDLKLLLDLKVPQAKPYKDFPFTL